MFRGVDQLVAVADLLIDTPRRVATECIIAARTQGNGEGGAYQFVGIDGNAETRNQDRV